MFVLSYGENVRNSHIRLKNEETIPKSLKVWQNKTYTSNEMTQWRWDPMLRRGSISCYACDTRQCLNYYVTIQLLNNQQNMLHPSAVKNIGRLYTYTKTNGSVWQLRFFKMKYSDRGRYKSYRIRNLVTQFSEIKTRR